MRFIKIQNDLTGDEIYDPEVDIKLSTLQAATPKSVGTHPPLTPAKRN